MCRSSSWATARGRKATASGSWPCRTCPLARSSSRGPEEGCPTGEMFRRLDAIPREFRDFPTANELYNDFARVAPRASLDLIARLLDHGARDAGLTGSGSVAFGRFDHPDEAHRAARAMRSEAPWVHEGHTVTRARSPRVV